ncbi:MAG: UvrD-helicase domain-containing protein [Defluviitaleaceae bacterium]|nr:UvrD-helicase domain-containing protein [Defluviitaleaceae bacterium]
MKNNLNSMQQAAIKHIKGPLLIFAGAGSGKTRVLTHRIAHLIEKGVDPYNILAITFTNKAAKEMKERAAAIADNSDRCWISTFHSACVRILRIDIDKIGYNTRFSIFDAADSERLIKDILEELNLDTKLYPAKYIASVISGQKNELKTPDDFYKASAGDFNKSNIAEVYNLYQQRLKLNNALDFDDIIFNTVELFKQCPDVLERYQNRFYYIMVDEYQDTNNAQYMLVSLLAKKYQNICVVGDDDQSIYGWRGANIQNILNFNKDFPKAKVIKLEQNYRSTKTILGSANSVISNNVTRSEKSLWTENISGEKIKVYKAENERDEAAFTAVTIKLAVQNGAKYSDFAVLYRTNSQSRPVEDRFVISDIPYRIYGGIRFYERAEIKDLLSYLKAIDNPSDNIALTRIINVPRRNIGKITIQEVQQYAYENGISMYYAIKESDQMPKLTPRATVSLEKFANLLDGFSDFAATNTITAVIKKVLADTDYIKSLQDGTVEAANKVENINELLTKAVEFENANPEEPTLSAFLAEVSLVADIDNYEEQADTVSLMTMHSAKGLEFANVFIAGFEEGIFPTYRSATSGNLDDLEEERRLCYVGITRAKQTLHLTWPASRIRQGREMNSAVSRFIKEIPQDNYEYVYMQGRSTTTKPPISPRKAIAEKQVNPYRKEIPAPKNKPFNFSVGDRVRQMRYGAGEIIAIDSAGADYEVTIKFDIAGEKKLMANLLKLVPEN